MKIKKVDDKPMVIHTKEKAKIHAHEPKGAKIKGSNIYTVERGPKVHDAKANEMDKKASAKLMLQKSAGGKRTYRKSTIHQSEAKDKALSRFKRNIRESGTSIKTKNTNLHIAGRTGALAAGAVTEQVKAGMRYRRQHILHMKQANLLPELLLRVLHFSGKRRQPRQRSVSRR